MRTYILRRLIQAVPLLLGVSALTFLVLKLAPGDFLSTMAENPAISAEAIDSMRHRFGLDQPWWIQYGLSLRNLFLHFAFGESFSRHQPVFTVLREGLGNTLLLASAAAAVTWCLAIPLGVFAAVRQYSWVDKSLSVLAFIWLSVPEVLSGLLLLLLPARTRWFPGGGLRSLDSGRFDRFGKAAPLLPQLLLPPVVGGLFPPA